MQVAAFFMESFPEVLLPQKVEYYHGPFLVTLINAFPLKRKSPAPDPNQRFPDVSSKMLCTQQFVSPSVVVKVVNVVPLNRETLPQVENQMFPALSSYMVYTSLPTSPSLSVK